MITMAKIEWYDEFVNLKYKPAKDDLIALFYFEPAQGMNVKEVVGRIASESSTGTWTTLFKMPPRMKKLKAIAYEIDGNYVKIAYPYELWESGNMAQLYSGIAGNIFGMKAVKNLRLIDVQYPLKYLKNFRGPLSGMEGIRKRMGIYDRPLLGAVPKPKVGFSALEHAQVGYETWMGGFDFVKDDENLSSQSFNKFEDRVKLLAKYRDKAEKETGAKKSAFINITADIKTMEKRAKLVKNNGFDYVMLDVVVIGNAGMQTMMDVCHDLDLETHGHRAMHSAFTRNMKHGISMQFLAKTMRILGVSQIHSGTGVGKLTGSVNEIKSISNILREKKTPEMKKFNLEQDWGSMKTAFPVSSGGLHPGLVPDVMKIYGNDMNLLVSGGIHGHPRGTRAGAMATVQAVEAFNDGITLQEKAKTNKELAEALKKWGVMKTK
jgi:ribulose-bisphosphate carboxylase large chain